MTKVAIASQGENVSPHFGSCPNFNIFDIEDGAVTGSVNVESPGHDCGGLPGFLKSQGADVVVSGGMGQGALNNLQRAGMDVILGASGTAAEAAEKFARGELVSTGSLCNHNHEHGHGHGHGHGGGCGHH